MDVQERLLQLIMGGEITFHSHPHTVTLDQYHRMQQLEDTRFITANFSPSGSVDFIFADTTSGTVNVYLPSANAGQRITSSRIAGGNNLVIVAPAGETINGAASITINTNYAPRRLKAIKGLGYLEI